MFTPVTKKAQYFLLGEFLGIEQKEGEFEEEIRQLRNEEYLDDDLIVTKKGQAFCHKQNKIGVNFGELVGANSRKANIKLAEAVINKMYDLGEVGRKDLERFAMKLRPEVLDILTLNPV